jgi:hypothetical protein
MNNIRSLINESVKFINEDTGSFIEVGTTFEYKNKKYEVKTVGKSLCFVIEVGKNSGKFIPTSALESIINNQ